MEYKYISEIRLERPIERGSYLAGIAAVKYIADSGGLRFDRDITIFTGENGSGKSTLIEAIAVCAGLNAEGGSKNFRFETNDTCSDLSEHLTLSRSAYPKDTFFLRAESLYNAATYLDSLGDSDLLKVYGGRSLHEQSHGESFLATVRNRFRGKGLYILDEPEAALSPSGQMSLLHEMDRLRRNDSQIIMATHSPILLAFPGARIYEIRDSGIFPTEYDKCRNVRIYRDFLTHTEENLGYIFSEL